MVCVVLNVIIFFSIITSLKNHFEVILDRRYYKIQIREKNNDIFVQILFVDFVFPPKLLHLKITFRLIRTYCIRDTFRYCRAEILYKEGQDRVTN